MAGIRPRRAKSKEADVSSVPKEVSRAEFFRILGEYRANIMVQAEVLQKMLDDLSMLPERADAIEDNGNIARYFVDLKTNQLGVIEEVRQPLGFRLPSQQGVGETGEDETR